MAFENLLAGVAGDVFRCRCRDAGVIKPRPARSAKCVKVYASSLHILGSEKIALRSFGAFLRRLPLPNPFRSSRSHILPEHVGGFPACRH
nr:hypothetical protein [Poriferisphaera corsica]